MSTDKVIVGKFTAVNVGKKYAIVPSEDDDSGFDLSYVTLENVSYLIENTVDLLVLLGKVRKELLGLNAGEANENG